MLALLRVPSTGDRVGGIDPPISQGLVAASLRETGEDAVVLDLTWAAGQGAAQLDALLDDRTLEVLGMTAYQTNIARCLTIAHLVRTRRPDVRVLLGGPQSTHMPAAALSAMPAVDALCRGPAEELLLPYLRAIRRRDDQPVRGFVCRTPAGIVEGSPPPPLPRDDCYPSPFLQSLWPMSRYPFGVLFTSRGCPYGCAFCYTPASSGRRVSRRSVLAVVRDVAAMAQAGVSHVFFADPIFVVDRDRTLALARALQALDAGMTFSCELRMEHVDRELLATLARAGFVKVAFGLETADPQVLAAVDKPTDLERFRDAVHTTLDCGIAVEVFHMYGLPGETFDGVLRTFDFVASLHELVDSISEPQQMKLYFGTEVLRRHRDYGIEIIGTRPPYLSPGTDYRTATLSPDDFHALEEEWASRRRRTRVPSGALPTGAECIES